MSFRLVPKSVTLSDLERRNGLYFALFRTNVVFAHICTQTINVRILSSGCMCFGEAVEKASVCQKG